MGVGFAGQTVARSNYALPKVPVVMEFDIMYVTVLSMNEA